MILHVYNLYQILIETTKSDSPVWLKYIPAASPIIVVLAFVVANYIAFHQRKEETRKTWYFKAYLEGYLKKVEEFFSNAESKLKEGLDEVIKLDPDSTERIEHESKTLEELADLKRKFEIEVLQTLKIAYPNIFKDISSLLLEFEDAGVNAFDIANKDTGAYFKYLSNINTMKSKLIEALSAPAFGKKK